MIEVLVTSLGLVFQNAELVSARSYHHDPGMELLTGTWIDRYRQGTDTFDYLITSACMEWHTDVPGCLDSTIELEMVVGVRYDINAYTEAENRAEPARDQLAVVSDWRFHPADINRDGLVNSVDIDDFTINMYDWNRDGAVDEEDLLELTALVQEELSDLNGDGTVGILDLLILLAAWGPCPDPPDECPADLDGDGTVGVLDMLILLDNWTV